MCSLLVTPRSCTIYALPMHVCTVLIWHVGPQAAAGAGLIAGGGGGVGVARPSTWDIVPILGALASLGVPDSVCDAVGEVAIDGHDDAVPLHCLGHVLLQGGVSPAIALRAVNQLVQVRYSLPSPQPHTHTLCRWITRFGFHSCRCHPLFPRPLLLSSCPHKCCYI